MKQYSRPRPFVAHTERGKREVLTCSTDQLPKRYIRFMTGPFKTLRGARYYARNTWLFARSVYQVERMAKR